MEEAAQFAARHALAVLFGLAAVGLLVAFVAWHLLEALVPRLLARIAPLWQRLDSRALAARYLGLHAAVSFAVAAAGTAAFVELADEIDSDEELGQFDVALAQALGESLSAGTLGFFSWLTHLGDGPVLTGIVLVVVLVLLLRREVLLAIALAVTTGGAGALNAGLKLVFQRERPPFRHELTVVDGFSFPSGHSAGSFAVYAMLAYLAVRLLPRAWHLPAVAVGMLLIVFVGASRVLLQVHFVSDVLAGWAGAATWSALCIAGLETWRLGLRRRSGRLAR